MLLREVSVENFRAFRHAGLRLPENGLVLIVGANNSGKSALLSALDVVAGDQGDVSSLKHVGSPGGCRVNALFSLTQDERVHLLAGAAEPERLLADGAATSLEFGFTEAANAPNWGLKPLGLTEIRGYWPGQGMVPFINTTMELENGRQNLSIAAGLQGNRPSPDSMDLVGADRSVGRPDWLDGLVHGSPQACWISEPLTKWRSSYYHFRALRQGTERSQGLASDKRLNPTGANLSAVLHGLVTDQPLLFKRLGELIAEIVPGIGQLQVRTIGGQRVVFETNTGDINMKDLGTGVEQLLMVLTVGLMEGPPFILLIEEPETNLHPAAQRALLGLLQSWAADKQIVAATHSTVMLDWAPGGDGLRLVTREHDSSDVNPVGEDRLAVLHSLGVHPSDILSADRVIIVEGASDEDVLRVWFPEMLRNPRVAVLQGQGGDNARHAARLADWLAGTDRLGLRQVLYIRDRDELSPRVIRKLRDSQTVHVLARRELENYLLDVVTLATVFEMQVPPGTRAPSAADIEASMIAAAESLRNTIIVNRVARQIVPPQQLMDTDLRHELAGASAAEISTAVLERLMTPVALHEQVTRLWDGTAAGVEAHSGADLLDIAPGKDVLDAVFMQFIGRHYKPRVDGVTIARAMLPPPEIDQLIGEFLSD